MGTAICDHELKARDCMICWAEIDAVRVRCWDASAPNPSGPHPAECQHPRCLQRAVRELRAALTAALDAADSAWVLQLERNRLRGDIDDLQEILCGDRAVEWEPMLAAVEAHR